LILLAWEPLYLIDGRSMRGEALVSGFIIVTLLSFLLFLDRLDRRYLFLSAALCGLALLTKLSALFLVGYVGLVLGIYLLAQPASWSERFRRGVAIYVLWILLAAFLFWALWPVMWVAPAEGVDLSFGLTFRGTQRYRHMYFLGQILYAEPLVYLFYPLVYLLRVTPLALLGSLAATVGLLKTLFNQILILRLRPGQGSGQVSNPQSANSLSLVRRFSLARLQLTRRQSWTLALFGFAVLFAVALSWGGHKYDRYLMPSLLAMDIVAAVGLCWLARWLWQRWLRSRLSWSTELMGGIGLAFLLLGQSLLVLPYQPHYFLYANPLLGGPRTAYNNFEMYSMFGLDQAAQYLNAQPQAQDKFTAAVNSKEFRPVLKGRWLPLDNLGEWSQADYVLIHIYQLQQQTMNPALLAYLQRNDPLHVVELAGLPFAWIYAGPSVQYFAGPSHLVGKANLLGYDLSAKTIAVGDVVSAKFYWENDGILAEDNLFLQLVDAGGIIWAETIVKPLPGFETAALTEDQFVESQAALTVPLGTPPGTYFLQSGVYSRARQETLGLFTLPAEGKAITVTRPSSPPAIEGLTMRHRLNVSLTSEVSLLGFDLADDTLVLNEENQVALWWQAQTGVKRDYVVSLQLLDSMDEEMAYWLGRPVLSGYPTNQWQAGEIVRDPWRLNLPSELLPGDYTLQLTLYDTDTETQVSRVKLGPVSVVTRRRQFIPPNMDHPVKANLDGQITLLGYDLAAEPIPHGGRLRVTLYWQAQEAMKDSYTVFVHLLKPDGTLAAQHDGPPASGAILTNDWAAGEVVTDRHQVEFANLPPGDYTLVTGMYHPTTGERLPTSGDDTAIRLQTLPIGP
jgi:hypothetical protein